ncbi:unnamed protein product [marine sediment metagenome]|uniref:Uncharacterized protein n=1 Tax=marine sediment metagenome TaxID=412755 RepID=X0WGH3_9ZZZZ
MFDKKVLEATGLQEAGTTEEGAMQYIGTDEQWNKANQLQVEVCEMQDNEVDFVREEEAEHDCSASPEDGCETCFNV